MNSYLDNHNLTLICLSIAVFRIYLEVVGFDFQKLPLTQKLNAIRAQRFHKMGFYMALGYFVFSAPAFF